LFLNYIAKYIVNLHNIYKEKSYLESMNKWLQILIGLILVIGTLLVAWYSPFWWGGFWNFRHAAWEFLKGGVVWFILMIGLLFLLLGISDLRD